MDNKFCKQLVSIIMPAYNAEKYIADSILSVLRQTYPYWELIVINDCSQDRTGKIIEQYMMQDHRIVLLNLEQNSGVAIARNEGIQKASGRYLAFLDSDDIWVPEKLQCQVSFMRERHISVSYTQYRQFDENVNEPGPLIDVEECIGYKDLLKGNIMGCLTVILDRDRISNIEMPSLRHEDYIAWLEILKQGFFAYGIKEDLARYRKSVHSLSGNKLKSILWTWRVYRDSQNLSIMESLYYLVHYIFKGIRKHR